MDEQTLDLDNAMVPKTNGSAALAHYDSSVPALPEATIGAVALTPEERAILDRPTDPAKIAVRPDGTENGAVIYIPHEFYRQRLKEAVGFGGFGERVLRFWRENGEVDEKTGEVKSEILYVWLALYVRGNLIGTAIGSHSYYLRNRRMDYGDVFESACSNAFVRICKHAALGLEPWDIKFREQFVAEHCLEVGVKTPDGKIVAKWRLKSSPPFKGEILVAKDFSAASPPVQSQPQTPPKTPAKAPALKPTSPAAAPPSSGSSPKEDPPVQPQAAAEPSMDLDAETAKATPEQIAQLEELTAPLNPEAVKNALKVRKATTFAELTKRQAQNIITKLTEVKE